MTPSETAGRRRRLRTAGWLAAGTIAGGVLAGTWSANAADSGNATTSGATAATYAVPGYVAGGAGAGRPANAFGSSPVRSDESAVSDSVAAAITEKAEARVSGATVYRVETDAGDGAYEAHMKKSDGSLVTVKFDKNLSITAVEDGMGQGDPAP